ncbi:hypothetical protein BDA99DRAFT_160373 [Phascolomyces articulosus]|uniref:Uncharacterized protein n=1 Tax=Phascolomyces articulosus TaxID=60185 RepID=A0AAD5PAT3_9FUNG|nr:hypothetical protein BDA99DRAFT_160373 [Phascolomyces articulosus]
MKRGKNKTAWGLDEAMDNLLIVEEQFPTTTTTTTTQQRQRQRQQLGQRPRSYSAAAPLPASPTSPTNQVHRISATPLSHHNSIASSASTRSTQSRHSTFSTSSSNTDNTLPVTVYEVPHTYDDNEPSPTTSQTTSDGVITLSPRIYVNQPHFVVAAFGMVCISLLKEKRHMMTPLLLNGGVKKKNGKKRKMIGWVAMGLEKNVTKTSLFLILL